MGLAYLLAGAGTLFILYSLARSYANADPRKLVRSLRFTFGGGLVVVGVVLTLLREVGIGGILIALGLSAITTGRIGPFDLGGSVRQSGSDSRVKSDWLEMKLDHDSGKLSGRVKRGQFAGRSLDDLSLDQLRLLAGAVAGSPDSASLLEAYLDRRFPGWREDFQGDGNARARGAADAGAMTDKEAYEILGLLPGAAEAEIRAAHRRLMKAVHPDSGGSTLLAAKINQAKDRLLGNHR
jgi:hypothetical protein